MSDSTLFNLGQFDLGIIIGSWLCRDCRVSPVIVVFPTIASAHVVLKCFGPHFHPSSVQELVSFLVYRLVGQALQADHIIGG